MSDLLTIVQDHWVLLLIGQYPNGPLGGLACTLLLSLLSILLAFPLGVAVALAHRACSVMSRRPIMRPPSVRTASR